MEAPPLLTQWQSSQQTTQQAAADVPPSSLLADINISLQKPEIRQIFDLVVRDNLHVAALGLGSVHVLLAFVYQFVLPPQTHLSMGLVATAVAAINLIAWIILRSFVLPPRFANVMLTGLLGVSVMHALLLLWVVGELRQTVIVLLLIIGASQFYLSIRWFTGLLSFTLLGWVWVTHVLFGVPYLFFSVVLIIGTVSAAAMFGIRRRAILRYELLRLQDEARKRDLEQRARELETSLFVGQRIVSILEPDDLLQQVVTLLQTRFDYDYVGVFLLDEDGRSLHMQAATEKEAQGLTLPVDEGSLIGWVAVNGRPLRTDDVQKCTRFVPLQPERTVCAELDLPLQMGRQMLGVITLQSEQVGAFSERDIPFMELLSTQVAIAVYNASVYQQERAARRLAELLQDTGRALASTLEWDVVIELILERLAEIVPYDRAGVMVPRGNALHLVASRGFPEETEMTEVVVPLENESIFTYIVEAKRPLTISDAMQRPDWKHVASLPSARSWLGVPLIRTGEVLGMLSLTRMTVRPYQDDEVKLAASFAAQAAIALENARVYEQKARFTEQLEYEVQHRTDAIRSAYEQLEQLNRSKSDFISIVSHELRTPVTILHGYSQMLLQDQAIQAHDMHHQLVSGIQSGAVRLEEIINSMLDVAKIDNQELKIYPAPVSLSALVRMVHEDLAHALAARSLTLEVGSMAELPVIEADPAALQKVLVHLLTNAIKYTPDGGAITVTGSVLTTPGLETPPEAVEIVVADTGIGIDPAVRELIFTKFYQTGEVSLHSSSKTQFKGGGPGLGLAVARGLIEAHRGRIWVESPGHDEETCPGSAFHVVLPIKQK